MIGTLAFLYLLKPFAYPIFWAAVIAGIFGSSTGASTGQSDTRT
jgi:predicted PurR-regulated permease PerM